MNLDNLRDVYHDQLKDMYSAEKQLLQALPKMLEAASEPELKRAFQHHLNVTQNQFNTLSEMLDAMGVNPSNTQCKAMAGLIEEAEEIIQKAKDDDARDAALICAAQKTEHYEIATYGSLRTWARTLGSDTAADTLQKILDEEYEADEILNRLAEGALNWQATD